MVKCSYRKALTLAYLQITLYLLSIQAAINHALLLCVHGQGLVLVTALS